VSSPKHYTDSKLANMLATYQHPSPPPRFAFQNIHDYGDGLSGWYVLLMKLTGWRNLPDFGTILLWLSCFHSNRQVRKAQSESLIDLYAPSSHI
jgi:hypothetical protein